jgi:hypothetical protein
VTGARKPHREMAADGARAEYTDTHGEGCSDREGDDLGYQFPQARWQRNGACGLRRRPGGN